MKDVVIYQEWIPRVGGIETATYTLAKLFVQNGYKTRLMFKGSETETCIIKYGDYADLIRHLGETVKCDIFINMSNYDLIPVQAKKKIQIVHSDYEKYQLELKNIDEIDQYVAVSQNSADVIKKICKVKCKVIYNLLDPDFKILKTIKFVTNTRISPEKGFNRMALLCGLLRKNKIPFSWYVYGDNPDKAYQQLFIDMFKDYPEVHFWGYVDDVKPGLDWADYMVLLSDFEGCPYAVIEAFGVGVPCILSDYKGARELVDEGKNGYILPMDMKLTKADVLRIKKVPKFQKKILSNFSDWEDVIQN